MKKVEDGPREGSSREGDDLPADLRLILQEIEREKTPERLVELARKLQAALGARRSGGKP